MAFTLYIAPQASDKTRTSISWLLGDPENRIIIACTEFERRRVISEIARATDTKSASWYHHVVRWDDRNSLLGIGQKEICIDNADLILQSMFSPHALYAITMSIENVIEPDSASQNR